MNNKIGIIFRREYLTKVRSRAFILGTLLAPLSLVLFMIVMGLIFSYQGDDSKTVVIVDESNALNRRLKDQDNIYFVFSDETVEELITEKDKNWDILLHIPAIGDLSQKQFDIKCYADKALDFQKTLLLNGLIAKKIREFKIKSLEIPEQYLESLESNVSIETVPLDRSAQPQGFLQSGVAAGFGYVIGYALFLMIVINGSLVFQSVIQEKTNRIVEVMISTVKPFQLMFGKILATVFIGLTQLAIWMAIVTIVFFVAFGVLGIEMNAVNQVQTEAQLEALQLNDIEEMAFQISQEIAKINWIKGIFSIIIFFFGGNLLYTSLFAAMGALAGDDIQQSNQLTLPIMMLLMVGIYLIVPVVSSPESSLAFWASLIPFFSPLLMPALSVMDIPIWQYLLSLVILIGSCVLITWLAAKIYRFGILMYGKRVTLKQVLQYLFNK